MKVHLVLGLILCISITCQMLGAPISFFHFDDPFDLVESSIQEGFSLASHAADWNPARQRALDSIYLFPRYQFSPWSDVFHPPLPEVQ